MNDKELIQAIRGAVKEEIATELTAKLGVQKKVDMVNIKKMWRN